MIVLAPLSSAVSISLCTDVGSEAASAALRIATGVLKAMPVGRLAVGMDMSMPRTLVDLGRATTNSSALCVTRTPW